MTALRVGNGFDVHPLVEGRRLVLAGVEVEHDRGLEGHSDGDVACHAVTDALLGACGRGDIGEWFPSGDPKLEGADSHRLLSDVWTELSADGVRLVNVDVTLIAQAPRLAPHRAAMQLRLAGALGLEGNALARVHVKATTTDHLGFTGRGEGIAALVTCLVELPDL